MPRKGVIQKKKKEESEEELETLSDASEADSSSEDEVPVEKEEEKEDEPDWESMPAYIPQVEVKYRLIVERLGEEEMLPSEVDDMTALEVREVCNVKLGVAKRFLKEWKEVRSILVGGKKEKERKQEEELEVLTGDALIERQRQEKIEMLERQVVQLREDSVRLKAAMESESPDMGSGRDVSESELTPEILSGRVWRASGRIGGRDRMLGDDELLTEERTLSRLLPSIHLFQQEAKPGMKEVRQYEDFLKLKMGPLDLEKASKYEVAYWLFDAARLIGEIKLKFGLVPRPLIDLIYVDMLFGKGKSHLVPMSIRLAQRVGGDILAVPKTIYRDYCNRLSLNTVFEKLSRSSSNSVHDWWARVEMAGDMCGKSLPILYAKFVDQGGDYVEREAEKIENDYAREGKTFVPTLNIIRSICQGVKGELGRYKKLAGSTARTHRAEGAELEREMLMEEMGVRSAGPTRPVRVAERRGEIAEVDAVRAGGGNQCYNCQASGHMAWDCTVTCRRHPQGGPRNLCPNCAEARRLALQQKYGQRTFSYRPPPNQAANGGSQPQAAIQGPPLQQALMAPNQNGEGSGTT